MADDEPKVLEEGEEKKEVPVEPVVEEVEEEEVDEESILTEYDPDDFVSGAFTSLDCTLPFDLFEFQHSFGYDCHKYFNLCACDDTVVAWASGSIITFMDVKSHQTWFRRSTTGGTVGNITSYRKDPNYRIAIAEAGEGLNEPLILLYLWPQMQIDAVLRGGTSNAYSVMDFSPDGELLASVGREPDYNLTVWNWKKHRALLRTSAFSYDVNAVKFSPYCPGQLTTAGAAHIKFWKMAQTFTGLKLQGELGRFGKTEICDVVGVYPMPDEKVLSGCEWGNILVWEAGLVKVEVTQRGRKTCHKGPVIQLMLSEAGDEVTTIARDGCIRAWYWDTVEQADPPEDDPYVEVNPVAETCVPGCQIMCLRHQNGMFWYCQDGNGGLWTVELELDKVECQHTKVMTCHAGGVVAAVALRGQPLLITAGADGALHAYNTETCLLLVRYQFPVAITCVLYPPVDVDPSSRLLLVGFADGVVRTMFLHAEELAEQKDLIHIRVSSDTSIHGEGSENVDLIDLIALLKPHSKAVNQITINEARTLLVTSGEDKTIFLYKLELSQPFKLSRLGYIDTPYNIAYMTWKPDEEFVILLCGEAGLIMETELPDAQVREYSEVTTFKLEFKTHKDSIIKKHNLRNRPFPTEEDLASLDEEALKAKEELAREKDDESEEQWIGEIELLENDTVPPTTITWAKYCEEGIWVIQKGTGALLLVRPNNNKILKYGPFPGSWCEDITVLKFVCDERYLVVGTGNGYIRVVRMPADDEDTPEHHLGVWLLAQQKLFRKLKGRRLAETPTQPTPRIDFEDYYYLPMHDRYTGAINCLEFSSDSQFLYTCGSDGNIFSYRINFTEPLLPEAIETIPPPPKVKPINEPSTLEGELMSHEQLKRKEEYDKMMAIAAAHKKRVRKQLSDLTTDYNKLIKLNRQLPCSQQIDVTLDPRPLVQQEVELADAAALTRRKLAHQLEASDLALYKMHSRNIIQLDVFPFQLRAIRDLEIVIRPLRQKNLSKAFFDQLNEVYEKMAEAALRGRNIDLFEKPQRAESRSRRAPARKMSWGPPRVASFLLGLPANPHHVLKKALRNYYQRLNRHHEQFVEWQEHLSRKPDPNALPPGAEQALREAEATIGNQVLKTHPDYVAPPGHNTQLKVCLTRQEIYEIKHNFNLKVVELREHKLTLVERIRKVSERLGEIRMEIPARLAKQPPPAPQIDDELEFPEKHLEVIPELATTTPRMTMMAIKKQERKSTVFVYPQPRIRPPRVNRFVPLMETRPLTVSWELCKPRPDHESTNVEIEIRDRRINRHLYEQDMLLEEVNRWIRQFDSRMAELQRERVRVQETNQLLELQLIQLHREMNVLNRFEAHEDRLAERVYAKLVQVRGIQDQITECEHRIEEHQAEKVRLDGECQDLQRQFKRLVQDNKFADFLRRIFKKKYRAPRVLDDDESSESEESSSSSEEEDAASVDSRDIGPIRLDPTICPEGCEQEIYDKTFLLRNTRQKHEQDMIEQDRLVELLRKDIDAHNRVKRKLSFQLERRQNDLREFMMEKQSCMNDIEQVIVLRYDQIRASALVGCTGADGLSKTVVFSEAMLARLRRRVLELQEEIKAQKLRHAINRTHLHRMNIDLRAMEAQAEETRAEMRIVLTHKLGKPRRVDRTLDELLRQMTRQFKFAASSGGTMPQMMAQIRDWQIKHSDLEKRYLASMEKYSERLRLAAALQSDVLPQKALKDPHMMVGPYSVDQYRRDVVRLRIVRAQQRDQIKTLREEIQVMKLKPASDMTRPVAHSPAPTVRSEIELYHIPRTVDKGNRNFFPVTPLGSKADLHEVNLMGLLYDCLDALRVSRDDAPQLLQELTAMLPEILSGSKSRYDVVDTLVRDWLTRYGGDPRQYKKHTTAFDTLAMLTDKLLREHIDTMENGQGLNHRAMSSLEQALKQVSDQTLPLSHRLAQALAALLHNAVPSDIETIETMSSLINSLIDDKHPLRAEDVEKIDVLDVAQNVVDLGIELESEQLERLVRLTVVDLRAQLLDPDEAKKLDVEVEKALNIDQQSVTPLSAATSTSLPSDLEDTWNEDECDETNKK